MTAPSQQLTRRLRDGLERLGVVLRADQWAIAKTVGLNPTQTHVLAFMVGRGEQGARVGTIAAELGVTQPTATESVAALIRKGLLTKTPDAQDSRAVAVRITPPGRDVARGIGLIVTATERALDALSIAEQTELLQLVITTIRALQVAGAIAPQRMCVTCRYFRPNAHANPQAPHHCAYVDAPFGAAALRINCGEHEVLPEADLDTVWRRFASPRATGSKTQDATQ
jgi:DNA-binding MarR family transcriptional regulator